MLGAFPVGHVKVNMAHIAKSEQYSVKQLSVQTESSPVRGKP